MAIRSSGAYNNPELAQAAENIASLFAPPSASDLASYSTARSRNQQSDIIAQLAKDPRYQGFDHQSILADLYDPTQSFHRVGVDDATTRRGQDVSASTSITNNQLDNKTDLVKSMFGDVSPGDMRPALPSPIARDFGLPGLPQIQGNPKPLSLSEQEAIERQNLIETGQLTDADILAAINGEVPVENIVGEDGRPKVVRRPDAVGQEPYFNKGAEAKPANGTALLPSGQQVPAVQGQDGVWRHAQTGAPLPQGVQVFDMSKATGTAEEIGLSKPTNTSIEKQILDIRVAKSTAQTLRQKIADSPAAQGAVGWLRGTAQNLLQTGGELGAFFGGNVADINAMIEEGLADANLVAPGGAFDPNIPAIDMLANLLAFQYAKTTTGERLSNEMLRATRAALGLDGLDANQAKSLAAIDQAIEQIDRQESILMDARKNGLGDLSTPAVSGGSGSAEEWMRDASGKLVRAN